MVRHWTSGNAVNTLSMYFHNSLQSRDGFKLHTTGSQFGSVQACNRHAAFQITRTGLRPVFWTSSWCLHRRRYWHGVRFFWIPQVLMNRGGENLNHLLFPCQWSYQWTGVVGGSQLQMDRLRRSPWGSSLKQAHCRFYLILHGRWSRIDCLSCMKLLKPPLILFKYFCRNIFQSNSIAEHFSKLQDCPKSQCAYHTYERGCTGLCMCPLNCAF